MHRTLAWCALPLLAGCMFFGHCPETTTGAYWNDPALFGAIDREATMLQAGIPLQGGSVASLRMDGPVAEGGGFRIEPGGLFLQARSGESQEDVERGLRIFLANTTADVDEGYVESFLGSRQEVGEGHDGRGAHAVVFYNGSLPPELRLQQLYDRTVGDQPPAARMQDDGWRWDMVYPAKTIVLGPGDLTVDAVGDASFDHRWAEGTTAEDAQADLMRWLEDAGLPTPAGGIETDTVVC